MKDKPYNYFAICNDVLLQEFNITYSVEDKEESLAPENEGMVEPVNGFLKLEFDYRDNLLPRSIVSFYYSNNGSTWNQIGSDHTSGVVIDLIENDSFFEVGGWGDGQSPGDQYLSGFIKSVKIETNEYNREYTFSKQKRDIDYLILTPLNKNEFEACQLSKRGGKLHCRLANDRVFISGNSIIYFDGMISIV